MTEKRQVDLKRLRELAGDPNVSVLQAAVELEIPMNRLHRICQHGQIPWSPKKTGISVDEDRLRALAADSTMDAYNAGKILGCSKTTVLRKAQQLGLTWVLDRKRSTGGSADGKRKPIDPSRISSSTQNHLRRVAPDPYTTKEQVAHYLGISPTTVGRYIQALGLEWASPRDRKSKGQTAKQDYTRGGDPMRQKDVYQRKQNPPRKRSAPNTHVPELHLTRESQSGIPGFRWHCPTLELSGWRAGEDREDVEDSLRRDLSFPLARRSGDPKAFRRNL